jgi:hypothetical protein
LNNASFGLYADIVDHAGYREHKRQVTQNVLQSLVSGRQQPYELQFSHEDRRFSQAVQVLVGINEYQTLNVLELGRREHLDGHVLQITALTALSNQTVRHLLGTVHISTGRCHNALIFTSGQRSRLRLTVRRTPLLPAWTASAKNLMYRPGSR